MLTSKIGSLHAKHSLWPDGLLKVGLAFRSSRASSENAESSDDFLPQCSSFKLGSLRGCPVEIIENFDIFSPSLYVAYILPGDDSRRNTMMIFFDPWRNSVV